MLFVHLVEKDFRSFDRELKRDPEELLDCWHKVAETQDISLLRQLEKFVSDSTGKSFSFAHVVSAGINHEISTQYPNARSGDTVTLSLDRLKVDVVVGENSTFKGMTVEQMSSAFDIPESEVEKNLFKFQVEEIGNCQQADYLDVTDRFWHPLAATQQRNGKDFMNMHALASVSIDLGYLNVHDTDDGGATARQRIKETLGDLLTPKIEASLFDRHKPTIYQVCSQLEIGRAHV